MAATLTEGTAEATEGGFTERVQMRAGVAGISMCVMPSGASASQTALMVAASEPTVPASPTPFAPSEFTLVGTSRVRIVMFGRSCARGIM